MRRQKKQEKLENLRVSILLESVYNIINDVLANPSLIIGYDELRDDIRVFLYAHGANQEAIRCLQEGEPFNILLKSNLHFLKNLRYNMINTAVEICAEAEKIRDTSPEIDKALRRWNLMRKAEQHPDEISDMLADKTLDKENRKMIKNIRKLTENY